MKAAPIGRSARVLAAGAVLALAALSCASPPPPAAWLRVEVWQGATALASPTPPQRVHLVLDLTSSMGAPAPGLPVRPAEAARTAARELLEALPTNTGVVLHALGISVGRACTPPVRSEAPVEAGARARLAATVARLEPRSESSLAEALDDVRRELAAETPPGLGRVVVISDLRGDCAADVCAAFERLVRTGATVDVSAVAGDPPACLAELEVVGVPPGGEALVPPPPPGYRVERPDPETGEARVVARGRAGAEPRALPPGAATVVVESDPPVVVGPVDLAAGQGNVVRVVRFPEQEIAWSAWVVPPPSAAEEAP